MAATQLYQRAEPSTRVPRDWRTRLPEPAAYYQEHVTKLHKPNAEGWAQAHCPFHEDKTESLSIHMRHGGWRCFAGCGKGDMVAYHMRITGLPFRAAVRDLLGFPT